MCHPGGPLPAVWGDGAGLAANNKTHKEIFMNMMGVQAAKGAKNIFAMTN